MKNIWILNGVNLNLLGDREVDQYGSDTLKDIESYLKSIDGAVPFSFFQTNQESQFVQWIHDAKKEKVSGLIINAAAWTHTSIAIRDALLAVNIPFIEVHLSNVYKRESFRHHSYLSDIAQGVICGLKKQGYGYALDYFKN